MAIEIESRARIFPRSHESSVDAGSEFLSILDNTVLNYATSGCIWFYRHTFHINELTDSLQRTLDAYSQWAGLLHFAPYKATGGHVHRQGRMVLSCNAHSDPGVEFICANADFPMSSMFPTKIVGTHFDSTKVDYNKLLDGVTSFAPGDDESLPGMKIQITAFTDASTAIAIGLAHPLADAQSLVTFAKDWTATHRAISSSSDLPILKPVFKPSLLSAAAAGKIDAQAPDEAILQAAAKLPIHRLDYWASGGPSCPDYAKPLTRIPQEISHLSEATLEKGTPIPWHDWDVFAPVSHVSLLFSAAETHAIYEHAVAHTTSRISHQDALLAHLWAALIRARQLKHGEDYFLDVSIDARRRVEPKLPIEFIGSPIVNIAVKGTASDAEDDVGLKAAAIRRTIGEFTSDSMAALLHEMAFELGAQRRWNCFLGRKHVIVTSWVGR